MIDRGIIKWQPFNSCMEPNKIIKSITNEKNRYTLPIFSEDQIEIINQKIIDAYNLQLIVNIKYYFNGKIYKTNGKIDYLNIQDKRIIINKKSLYIKQILNVDF